MKTVSRTFRSLNGDAISVEVHGQISTEATQADLDRACLAMGWNPITGPVAGSGHGLAVAMVAVGLLAIVAMLGLIHADLQTLISFWSQQ